MGIGRNRSTRRSDNGQALLADSWGRRRVGQSLNLFAEAHLAYADSFRLDEFDQARQSGSAH